MKIHQSDIFESESSKLTWVISFYCSHMPVLFVTGMHDHLFFSIITLVTLFNWSKWEIEYSYSFKFENKWTNYFETLKV